MIDVKSREVPTIEFLYIRDDNFKADVAKAREQLDIKTSIFEGEEIITAEEILKIDHKLINSSQYKKKYNQVISGLAIKYKLSEFIEDLKTFVEGELLTINMTNI